MHQRVMIKNKSDQVIDYIMNWLKSGDLKVGDKLPSERKLSEMLGVSLLTVNKAMSRLEDTAVLSRTAGRGTHVACLPRPDAIAVICDIVHINRREYPSYVDLMIKELLKSAKNAKMIPHFWIGRGKHSEDFLDSLGFNSAAWDNIKGVIAIAWKDGLEDALDERKIPLVRICTKHESRNALMLDYKALGRIAAKRILDDNPEFIHMIYNDDIAKREYNNPIDSFLEELRQHKFNLNNLMLIPSSVDHKAGYAIGESIGPQAKHIIFTDENISAGFAAWQREHKQYAGVAKRIITHATSGIDLGLPSSYDKLQFKTDEICNKAFKMLDDIFAAPWQPTQRSVFIEPVLKPDHN